MILRIILLILFLLLQLMPGSPFNDEKLSAEQISQLYAKYGLDESEIEFIETHVKEMT